MEDWNLEPECYVVANGTEFVHAADSYTEAGRFIQEVHEHQESSGEPLTRFAVYPCVISPGGRDTR